MTGVRTEVVRKLLKELRGQEIVVVPVEVTFVSKVVRLTDVERPLVRAAIAGVVAQRFEAVSKCTAHHDHLVAEIARSEGLGQLLDLELIVAVADVTATADDS